MKLFSPIEIKKQRQSQEEENKNKAIKVAGLLTNQIHKLNEFKEIDSKERQEIVESRKKLEKEVESRKEELLQEVSSLEARKREALLPLDTKAKLLQEKEKELERLEADNVLHRKELDSKETELEYREDILDEKLEDLEERTRIIDIRDEQSKKASEITQNSLKELNQKWLDYHEHIASVNASLAQREAILVAEKKELMVIKEELRAREAKVVDDRKAIKDGYETLAKANEEIMAKKK